MRSTNCSNAASTAAGIGVVVEVVGLDVGDDRAEGRQQQEGAVALVGLGDEDVAAAGVGVAARLGQVAADGERRMQPGVLQRHREHRRGGRLAVGAGDGDAPAARTSAPPAPPPAGSTRSPSRCASTSSGLLARIAVEVTTVEGIRLPVPRPPRGGPASWPTKTVAPSWRSAASTRLSRASLPLTTPPAGQQQPRDAAHPGAADPDQVDAGELGGQIGGGTRPIVRAVRSRVAGHDRDRRPDCRGQQPQPRPSRPAPPAASRWPVTRAAAARHALQPARLVEQRRHLRAHPLGVELARRRPARHRRRRPPARR